MTGSSPVLLDRETQIQEYLARAAGRLDRRRVAAKSEGMPRLNVRRAPVGEPIARPCSLNGVLRRLCK